MSHSESVCFQTAMDWMFVSPQNLYIENLCPMLWYWEVEPLGAAQFTRMEPSQMRLVCLQEYPSLFHTMVSIQWGGIISELESGLPPDTKSAGTLSMFVVYEPPSWWCFCYSLKTQTHPVVISTVPEYVSVCIIYTQECILSTYTQALADFNTCL